jgi:hypothetical protein
VLPFKLDGHLESNAPEDSDRNLNTYSLSLIVKAFLRRNLLDHEDRTIKANVRGLLTCQGLPYGCRESIENNKNPDDVTRSLISLQTPVLCVQKYKVVNSMHSGVQRHNNRVIKSLPFVFVKAGAMQFRVLRARIRGLGGLRGGRRGVD